MHVATLVKLPDEEVLRKVRDGEDETDAAFDSLYPRWAVQLSSIHWTPVRVAVRAVELLMGEDGDRRNTTILDVGSGVGKFCIIAALRTERARFVGVEQRPHFVELSRQIAAAYSVDRVEFVHGNFVDVDWGRFRGAYLFNPFQENLPESSVLDRSVSLHPSFYKVYVSAVEAGLAQMKTGTRVVTYWGFGGRFPPSFRRITREFRHRGVLECWERQ